MKSVGYLYFTFMYLFINCVGNYWENYFMEFVHRKYYS